MASTQVIQGLDKERALSPLDGRYQSRLSDLADYVSDFALNKHRVLVEVEYLIALVPQIGVMSAEALAPHVEALRKIYQDFTIDDCRELAKIEATTNHDVKAVEYFLQPRLRALNLEHLIEFIHFAITSQDINNVAYPLMLKGALEKVILPRLQKLLDSLREKGEQWLDVAMLARTHGQPATPTRVGKELMVWVERISNQLEQLRAYPKLHQAKFGGAIGCFNAHCVAYPEVDWLAFADRFISSLGLYRQQFTTQIEHYDGMATIFHSLQRINTILMNLSRDVWAYVSLDYFRQRVQQGEVGSSTMPHKVNPIDFENAEGNLGVANALFDHFAAKLPISRLQRDLSDSTVLRNIGIPLGHTLVAFSSLATGLSKLELNQAKLDADLRANWVVIAEAIQTILRREKVPNAYELLKEFTRTHSRSGWTKESFDEFIQNLAVSEPVKQELLHLTPFNYIGCVPSLHAE
jgi:adenylosuccinate lyase